ncbi:MAG TPA: hypothetical protein PLP05_06675 [Sedimentisphaerales bacterium]|nr:hypothetical protein [Sedimentisphaerales bacterium]
MYKKLKIGKLSAAVCITALIWIWADLALDTTFESAVTLTVAKAATNELFVSFDKKQTSINIENIVFKGPTSKISLVQRQFNDGSFDTMLFFDHKLQEMAEPGEYTLDVRNFLKQDERIKKLGITVVSCQPEKVKVSVVKLVKKPLGIRCLNESRVVIKTSSVEPAQIEMFVPEEWSGDALMATLQLTKNEVELSKKTGYIEKTPFIELYGQRREAQSTVKISISPDQENMADYTITTPTLGIILSPILQGKYIVEVINENAVIGAINIHATADARTAYENMRYKVILEIDDSDVKEKEPRRTLIYNFPPEFAGRDEIELKTQPVEAKFKLIRLPVTAIETPTIQP